MISPASRLADDCRGTAAVEFALIGPMLCALLLGTAVYGGYFTLANEVQQLANDSARAALAGLSADERRSLASQTMTSALPSYVMVDPDHVRLDYAESGGEMRVAVTYDGGQNPLWAFSQLIPMPSNQLRRSAAVHLGGF